MTQYGIVFETLICVCFGNVCRFQVYTKLEILRSRTRHPLECRGRKDYN